MEQKKSTGSKELQLKKLVTVEILNQQTGELEQTKLEQDTVIETKTKRPNGTLRVQVDYSASPSRTDKSKLEHNDVNKLMKKHSISEIDALLKYRNSLRQPIQNYDETKEPTLLEAKNEIVRLKNAFNTLDPKVRKQFDTVADFIAFIDDPKNDKDIERLGLIEYVKPKLKEPAAPAPTEVK